MWFQFPLLLLISLFYILHKLYWLWEVNLLEIIIIISIIITIISSITIIIGAHFYDASKVLKSNVPSSIQLILWKSVRKHQMSPGT